MTTIGYWIINQIRLVLGLAWTWYNSVFFWLLVSKACGAPSLTDQKVMRRIIYKCQQAGPAASRSESWRFIARGIWRPTSWSLITNSSIIFDSSGPGPLFYRLKPFFWHAEKVRVSKWCICNTKSKSKSSGYHTKSSWSWSQLRDGQAELKQLPTWSVWMESRGRDCLPSL